MAMQTICLLYPFHFNDHTANSPPSLYSDKLNKRGAPYSSGRNFFSFLLLVFFFQVLPPFSSERRSAAARFSARRRLLEIYSGAGQSLAQASETILLSTGRRMYITRSVRRHGIKRRLLTSDIIQVRRKERERAVPSNQSVVVVATSCTLFVQSNSFFTRVRVYGGQIKL